MLDAAERHSAKQWLEEFPPTDRRRGRQRYARGKLGELAVILNGRREVIREPEPNTPAVELQAQNAGWACRCTCGRPRCEHAYAAMQFLLKDAAQPPGETSRNGNPAEPDNRKLDVLMEAKLGRKLAAGEHEFIRNVQRLHQQARSKRYVSKYDVHAVIEFNWFEAPGTMPFNSRASKSELDFWNDLVAYALPYRARIPEFLKPVTDMDRVERMRQEQERKKAVAEWQNKLRSLSVTEGIPEGPKVDARLIVTPAKAQVQIRELPDGVFRVPKQREVVHWVDGIEEGSAEIEGEAAAIFRVLSELYYEDGGVEMRMDSTWAQKLLSGLFRQPGLAERLLTEEEKPFERAGEALRWELMEQDGGDYLLRLAGGAAEEVKKLAMLPGRPCLYLSRTKIFEGPVIPSALGPGPHVIPGSALETEDGLRLLTALGLELPPRLAARTRRVAMNVTVTCAIRQGGNGYDPKEYCYFDFEAVASEGGHAELFQSGCWKARSKRSRAGNNRPFYIFERARMQVVPGLIEGIGASWNYQDEKYRVRVTKNFPEKFLAWHKQIPPDVTVHLEGELASLVRDPVLATVQLECEEAGVDWFDLRTSIKVEDTNLTEEELKLLFNAKGRAVRLEGKGWRRLEYQLTEEDDASLARLGLTPHDFSPEPQRLHALQLAERAAENLIAAEQYRKIQARASEIKARVSPPVPEGVSAELRPYQLEGFHFLAYLSENSFGGVLADDMGLGKTVQTLCWLAWLRAKSAVPKPSLVVCPKSVMDNWAAEARKFVPGLRVKLRSTNDTESLAEAAEEADLLVLNYAQLRAQADTSQGMEWESVILDEAQAIKNPDSQTAQAARALRARHRLALSGTPIENRLLDLWSIMAFSMPGILGNRTDFKRRFDNSNDKFARRRLAARVRPFLLRRTKNQVAAELPDRIEEDLICELEGTQKTLYRAEFKRAQQMLLRVKTQEALNEFRFHFLTSLLRLRQICCHPALVGDEFGNDESAKLNALMELLEPLMEEGHKVLVFSQFIPMLHRIQAEVEARDWTSFYLAGDTEKRGELVERFQGHEGAGVFLISLKAGGSGLNLTAASYVVIYDPWWNPAVENQAIDRTHRIGQTQKVIAYRLLVKGSIEEKIRALQKQKGTMVDDVLGHESFASSLTLDDLRYLFAEDPEGA